MSGLSLLIESAVKVSLLVGGALAAVSLLPRASAALRHWILAAAIGCASLTPFLQPMVPAWSMMTEAAPFTADQALRAPQQTPPTRDLASAAATAIAVQLPADPTGSDAPTAVGPSMKQWLLAVWLGGASLCGLVLLAGLMRLTWLASKSRRIDSGPWVAIASDVTRLYGIRRPVRLLHSAHPSMLITWGVVRPRIILPAGAPSWSADQIRVVLFHEFAHIQRGDWLAQIAAEVLQSLHWFNPLVWLACARLREESEQACDDAVLSRGIAGPEYADHLVYFARALSARRAMWYPAPAMARPSSLHRRITAMLNARVNRTPLTASMRATIAAILLALTLPVAGFAAQTYGTFSGSVTDQTGGLVPKVSIVLTHVPTNTKHTVESGPSGGFEFVGLRAGDYTLETKAMGFAALKDEMTLSAGETVHRIIALQIGSLEETITLVHSDKEKTTAEADRARDTVAAAAYQARVRERIEAAKSKPCTPASIGGQIRPPIKVKDVKPVYPDTLRGTGVAGLVTMQARIGPEGTVREVQVVNAIHPDLASAAADAVRQWEFTPTLLNCVPIDVSMAVTTLFRVEP